MSDESPKTLGALLEAAKVAKAKTDAQVEVLAALDMALTEMVILLPRLTPTYAKGLQAAVDRIKKARKAYQDAGVTV